MNLILFYLLINQIVCEDNNSKENQLITKEEIQQQQNEIKDKKTVFITGSTGVMGTETLNEFCKHLNEFHLKLLVRPSKKNKKTMKNLLKKYSDNSIEVIWGDLLNYEDVLQASNLYISKKLLIQ